MARVELLNPGDLDPEYDGLLESFRTTDQLTNDRVQGLLSTDERNVYRALGHVPDGLRNFRTMGRSLWEQAGLSQRVRELVVLTVARMTDSHYEWHQHVRIALDVGFTEDELLALADWDLSGFDADERAFLEYTAAWVDGEVSRAVHDSLAAATTDTQLVAVNMLAGMYVTIARSMSALDIEVEEPFVGWHLERLPTRDR